MAWVILYDAENEIVGILYRGYCQDIKVESGDENYRINGFSRTSPGDETEVANYFTGSLSDEDLLRIDHISVMIEKQHTYLCAYDNYDLYKKYIEDHPE